MCGEIFCEIEYWFVDFGLIVICKCDGLLIVYFVGFDEIVFVLVYVVYFDMFGV